MAGLANDRGVNEGSKLLQGLLASVSFFSQHSHCMCWSTYPKVVGDHAVEEVNIVLAQILQVEELVNGGVLQSQLGEAASLLGFVALGARRCEAICAQVLANVGRVGSVIVGISI